MIQKLTYKSHDEWLAIRHKYIGGSDASAIIGMNPYKSAYSLWAEKTDRVEPFSGNLTTKVGSYLEELVAQLFTEETGIKVRKENKTYINDNYPFACANLDRLIVGEKAFLEIKTTNNFPLMRKLKKSAEFPDDYYCQCVHYLAVTGLKKCYLAVLINCRELKIFTLERDEDEINALMNAEKEFWHYVETDTEPDTDGSASTDETLDALYPNSDNEVYVDVSGYTAELNNYNEINEQIKELKKRKDEMANRVKAFMKDAGRGYCDGFKVMWGTQERRKLDENSLAAAHPEIDLNEYYVTTTTRQFRVVKKEDN